MARPQATIRLDKWLWQARFFKTRTLSSKLVSAGHVRLNATRITKPSVQVGAGDTLTFPQSQHIRVIRILDIGTRRGPATEARLLYKDLTPPGAPISSSPAYDAGGRPSRRQRRALARFKNG